MTAKLMLARNANPQNGPETVPSLSQLPLSKIGLAGTWQMQHKARHYGVECVELRRRDCVMANQL